jgi:hypothetical protein
LGVKKEKVVERGVQNNNNKRMGLITKKEKERNKNFMFIN